MQKKLQEQKSNVQLFTKIQQAYPSHLSTLSHKEVGYVVHVQHDKTYKINNCVESEHQNSQLYKRFSKSFLKNLNQGQNQMILCCGNQEQTRYQTSIGLKKNPGMFMIAAIAILDQKYQIDYSKYDVQISFIEYKDGKLYDLLTNTKQPLKPVKNDEKILISYGQTYVKINTFTHFLKLFKIAIFNNQQRDFKQVNNDLTNKQIKSSFIMNIVSKVYDQTGNGKECKTQKTTLIDLGEYCGTWTSKVGNEENGGQMESQSQKGIWEYMMIEINNMTNKKRQHYHLVEQNPLLSIIKQNLKSSKNYFIASLSADPQNFKQNYQWINNLSQLIDCVVPNWEQNKKICSKKNPKNMRLTNAILSTLIEEKVNKGDKKRISNFMSTLNSSFHRGISTAGFQMFEMKTIQALLKNLEQIKIQMLRSKHSSMREFRQVKEKCCSFVDEVNKQIGKFKKIYTKELALKRKKRIVQHCLINDEIRLIGSCVKSQHFKDFYSAKSYISLGREVQIKTQSTKEQLMELYHQKDDLLKKFNQLKGRSIENIHHIAKKQKKQTNISRNSGFKFTMTSKQSPNFTQKMEYLSLRISQYLIDLYYQAVAEDQRTVADQILKEEAMNQQIGCLAKQLNNLKIALEEAGCKNTCNFHCDQKIGESHINIFVREVRGMVKEENKRKKYENRIPSLLKSKSNMKILQNQKQNTNPDSIKYKTTQGVASSIQILAERKIANKNGKFSKLPILQAKTCENIVLTGQISLADILMDPNIAKN